MILVHKTRRLFDVNNITIHVPVQQSSGYIQRLHSVPFVRSYRKHKPQTGRGYHGTIGGGEINTFTLGEALGHQTRFVLDKISIGIELLRQNPSCTNDNGTLRRIY